MACVATTADGPMRETMGPVHKGKPYEVINPRSLQCFRNCPHDQAYSTALYQQTSLLSSVQILTPMVVETVDLIPSTCQPFRRLEGVINFL